MFCNGGSFGINTCLRAVKKIMIRSGQGQYTMGGDTTHTNGFNADDRGNWRHHNSKLVHGPHHHSIRIDNPNITLLQLQYSDINMKISLRQVIQTFYIPFSEECNCWESQISCIDYNILGIKIWIARMIQITSQVTLNI